MDTSKLQMSGSDNPSTDNHAEPVTETLMKSRDITGQTFNRLTAIRPVGADQKGAAIWECSCICGNTVNVRIYDLLNGRRKSCGCAKAKDISGQIFGRLTALHPAGRDKNNNILWLCQCECGNQTTATVGLLTKGSVKSCGCLRGSQPMDLRGQVFGRLTALEPAGKDRRGRNTWRCRCECGNEKIVPVVSLTHGVTRSCGCLRQDSQGRHNRPVKNSLDLTGQTFGNLTVLSLAEYSKDGKKRWLCQCTCGRRVVVYQTHLSAGRSKSCGCARWKDITGQRFGKLVAVEHAGVEKNGQSRWLCQCDCGGTAIVNLSNLQSGATKSCGCMRKGFMKSDEGD